MNGKFGDIFIVKMRLVVYLVFILSEFATNESRK